MAAEALGDATAHYTFVSSLSAYADEATVGQDETAGLATIEDPKTEEVTGQTYGALKVLAEAEVQRVFAERALVLRPGFICGPYDGVDRMPYWLRRLDRGGEVLAPERPDFPVQLIDARDIARFALAQAERASGGVFNLCAPPESHRFEDLLETAALVVGRPDPLVRWVSLEFMLEHGLAGWEALPWWAPPAELGVTRFDAARAFAAGLEARPVQESFRDGWAWDRTRPRDALRVGLTPEHEAELLDAWRSWTA
jgi:2'-hydroxyisoflavone reductase